MWSSNRWLTLGFIPLTLRYERPFEVLRPRYDGSFPIEKIDDKRWRIKPALARCWAKLQMNLLTLFNHVNRSSHILFPTDSELFCLPDTYGFSAHRTYGSRLRAQRAASESAAVFRILMAECSLLIAHDCDLINGMPRWEAALVNAGVPSNEIALYQRSELCDFGSDYPRTSVVFKPDALFQHLLACFLRANVPVWFIWTDTPYAHAFDVTS